MGRGEAHSLLTGRRSVTRSDLVWDTGQISSAHREAARRLLRTPHRLHLLLASHPEEMNALEDHPALEHLLEVTASWEAEQIYARAKTEQDAEELPVIQKLLAQKILSVSQHGESLSEADRSESLQRLISRECGKEPIGSITWKVIHNLLTVPNLMNNSQIRSAWASNKYRDEASDYAHDQLKAAFAASALKLMRTLRPGADSPRVVKTSTGKYHLTQKPITSKEHAPTHCGLDATEVSRAFIGEWSKTSNRCVACENNTPLSRDHDDPINLTWLQDVDPERFDASLDLAVGVAKVRSQKPKVILDNLPATREHPFCDILNQVRARRAHLDPVGAAAEEITLADMMVEAHDLIADLTPEISQAESPLLMTRDKKNLVAILPDFEAGKLVAEMLLEVGVLGDLSEHTRRKIQSLKE